MTEDDHIRAELEALGPAKVRDRLARSGYNDRYRDIVVEWLAQKDDEKNDTVLGIMRSSKNAAWAAAIAAFLAAAVALAALLRVPPQ